VFVGSCNGVLHGVDRQTGKVRWTYSATNDGDKPEFHGRPLVTSDVIVVGSDDRRPEGVGHVYAFDASNLKLMWKYRAGPGTMTDVLRFDRTVYVVTLTDELIALDLLPGPCSGRLAEAHQIRSSLSTRRRRSSATGSFSEA